MQTSTNSLTRSSVRSSSQRQQHSPGGRLIRPDSTARLASPTASAASARRASGSPLVDLVEFVRALAYGRPSDRTVAGMLRERRGTCSTKHLYLAEAMAARFPETEPMIIHRVYRLDRATAGELFGASVADAIPEDGLVDVHRYLKIVVDGRAIDIDATFPGAPWGGQSSLPLACGPGQDHPAGKHPDAEKRALGAQHCDPAVREPFIALLTGHPSRR